MTQQQQNNIVKKTVFDNFLEEKDFIELKNWIYSNDFEWFYTNHFIAYAEGAPYHRNRNDENNNSSYFFTHLFYDNHIPRSAHYERLLPLLNKIQDTSNPTGEGINRGIKSLMRIRANFYPNTNTMFEHPMHVDAPFSHTAATLAFNTCDGYLKFIDGTNVGSVANRIIFFDAGLEHCSTTTTNDKNRINIIVNFL